MSDVISAANNLDDFIYAVEGRYIKALDAKPGKGPLTDVDALTDSVCDIPELLRVIQSLRKA